MECKKCGSTNIVKNGRTATGQQQYHCRACGVYTVTGDFRSDDIGCRLARRLPEA
jgi:transposase-like protein